MKKLLVLLSIISVIFFFGCQENQVTEPIASPDKISDVPYSGVINLNFPATVPMTGECKIRGVIYYKFSEGLSNEFPQTSSKGESSIKLALVIDAKLVDLTGTASQKEWLIKGSSQYRLWFRQDKQIKIQEAYVITGRNDILLIVDYNVQAYSVSINRIFVDKL